MAAPYAMHISRTPQSEPMSGEQVQNNAGGYVFNVTPWDQLDRFLVLGAEGGTYYTGERTLTVENAKNVAACLAENPKRVVDRVVEISDSGRAPKNDPAIFVLAMACTPLYVRSSADRKLAFDAINKVCRIGTHLFTFMSYIKTMRGFGEGLRNAIAKWYTEKSVRDVAYQVTKYQSRGGWSHRDVFAVTHFNAGGVRTRTGTTPSGKPTYSYGEADTPLSIICRWAKNGWDSVGEQPHSNPSLNPIWAFEKAKRATSPNEIVHLIANYNMPRECVPTQFLNSPAVWDALLQRMPLTAMIRNLGKMTSIGLLKPMSEASMRVKDALSDTDHLRRERVHPMALLVALKVYANGHGEKGSLSWNPDASIVDALDAGFYKAFATVAPTNKRWLLALDVSASMESAMLSSSPVVSARVASAAMALVTAATEPHHHFVGFAAGRDFHDPGLIQLGISPRQRLDDVCTLMKKTRMGGTDCALPMLYASKHKMPVDVFVVYTDNETWYGDIHPMQALRQYRREMGIPAKLIVCGMTSTGFTVADRKDGGCLDVVGFDASAPQIMSQFATEGS